ncbi:TPM domain-containing protein [Lujinxingia litoralis]|uniref:TPM domain-containing protein n=1 Tax=Lujinxingia litoralis TaxID=2211119 RepID=UPI0018F7987B|nr:TPM domain-containing protein [Lujinxingia litoralis]
MRHLSLQCLMMLVLTLVASSALALSVEEVPNPRHVNAWVTDHADILTPEQELELNTMLHELEHLTSVEVALVTLHSVDAPTPKDFATRLFNYWGVGKEELNNGLLVLLVMDERRLEMETGYGLEGVLTDGWLATIQAEHMVPHFKEGQFGIGLTSGLAEIYRRLTPHPLPTPHPGPALPPTSEDAWPGGAGLADFAAVSSLADFNDLLDLVAREGINAADFNDRVETQPPNTCVSCSCLSFMFILLLYLRIAARRVGIHFGGSIGGGGGGGGGSFGGGRSGGGGSGSSW